MLVKGIRMLPLLGALLGAYPSLATASPEKESNARWRQLLRGAPSLQDLPTIADATADGISRPLAHPADSSVQREAAADQDAGGRRLVNGEEETSELPSSFTPFLEDLPSVPDATSLSITRPLGHQVDLSVEHAVAVAHPDHDDGGRRLNFNGQEKTYMVVRVNANYWEDEQQKPSKSIDNDAINQVMTQVSEHLHACSHGNINLKPWSGTIQDVDGRKKENEHPGIWDHRSRENFEGLPLTQKDKEDLGKTNPAMNHPTIVPVAEQILKGHQASSPFAPLGRIDYILFVIPPVLTQRSCEDESSSGVCGPRWRAFVSSAYNPRIVSWYNDESILKVDTVMHELGHNFGLGHSGTMLPSHFTDTLDASKGYGDNSCLMGNLKDLQKICYNAPKASELGIHSGHVDIFYRGRELEWTLYSMLDADRVNGVVIIQVFDFFIAFNGAVHGPTADSLPFHKDKVLVYENENPFDGRGGFGPRSKIHTPLGLPKSFPGESVDCSTICDLGGTCLCEERIVSNGNANSIIVKVLDRNLDADPPYARVRVTREGDYPDVVAMENSVPLRGQTNAVARRVLQSGCTGSTCPAFGPKLYALPDVPAGATVNCKTEGDNGDVSLYLDFGRRPTLARGFYYAQCRSSTPGTSYEECTTEGKADLSGTKLYALLISPSLFTDLTITCTINDLDAIPLTSGVPLLGQSAPSNDFLIYELPVQDKDTVVCTTDGNSGEALLYLRWGSLPELVSSSDDLTVNECSDFTPGTSLLCDTRNPAPGSTSLFVRLAGAGFDGYSDLTITCTSYPFAPTELSNNVPLYLPAATRGVKKYFTLQVLPEDFVLCEIRGSDGDANLLLRFGQPPVPNYFVDGYYVGSNEGFRVDPDPGDSVLYALVDAYEAYATVRLRCARVPLLLDDVALTGQHSPADIVTYYRFPVSAGQSVACLSTGTNGNADLFVRFEDYGKEGIDAFSNLLGTSNEVLLTPPVPDGTTIMYLLVQASSGLPYTDLSILCKVEPTPAPMAPSPRPTRLPTPVPTGCNHILFSGVYYIGFLGDTSHVHSLLLILTFMRAYDAYDSGINDVCSPRLSTVHVTDRFRRRNLQEISNAEYTVGAYQSSPGPIIRANEVSSFLDSFNLALPADVGFRAVSMSLPGDPAPVTMVPSAISSPPSPVPSLPMTYEPSTPATYDPFPAGPSETYDPYAEPTLDPTMTYDPFPAGPPATYDPYTEPTHDPTRTYDPFPADSPTTSPVDTPEQDLVQGCEDQCCFPALNTRSLQDSPLQSICQQEPLQCYLPDDVCKLADFAMYACLSNTMCCRDGSPVAPLGDVCESLTVGGTLCSQRGSGGGCFGDPHVKTWIGTYYDYHGVCDLVLLSIPSFGTGQGLRLHVRTTAKNNYSYIETAALQIGTDILELGAYGEWFFNGVDSAKLPLKMAGVYKITYMPTREM